MRAYHQLLHANDDDSHIGNSKRELTEAEEELLTLLKTRGVPSICDSISKEINYVWAVTSGFKTLAAVGHFYFACGSQTFGYNPAFDFVDAHGMQLALFALQKFLHNESVLVPVLECIHIYSKLHVDGAIEFLAVADATEIVLKCIRFHDNKHDVMTAACQALGSLVMNDLIKETVSSPALILELLGLVKRFHASLVTCRAALVPIGFLVTDATITGTFMDANGVALTLATLQRFRHDAELVWHAIGVLNGLHAKTLDARLIFAAFNFTGVQRIVEALAMHLATEEIAVDGFQLLAKLAAHREAATAINRAKVLDLAYVARFAYSGAQHRHTRDAIATSMVAFQQCTLQDASELAVREQPSRADVVLFAVLLIAFVLASGLSLYDGQTSDVVLSVERALVQRTWTPLPFIATTSAVPETTGAQRERALRDVHSINDVWSYVLGPLHETLFQDRWYNGDLFANDVDVPLGAVDKTNWLLGSLELRLLRVRNTTGCDTGDACFPPYARSVERTTAIAYPTFTDEWSDASASSDGRSITGEFATYPASGYRRTIARLNANSSSTSTSNNNTIVCGPYCQLTALRANDWIDRSARALVAAFTLYNGALDVHCSVTLLFEFMSSNAHAGARVVATADTVAVHLDAYPDAIFLVSPRFYVDITAVAALGWFAYKQTIQKALRYRWRFVRVADHVIDAAIVGLWVTAVAIRLATFVQAAHVARQLQLQQQASASSSSSSQPPAFIDVTSVAQLVETERCVLAVAAVGMWWRLVCFAQCVRPLARVLRPLTSAASRLHAFALVLVVIVGGAAQIGVLLWPASHAGFRSLGVSIASMAQSLVRRGSSSDGDSNKELLDTPALLFRFVFQLTTTFVLLNVAVVILCERFDTDKRHASATASDASTAAKDALLVAARKQLEASGMRVVEPSLPKTLLRAAARGVEKLQLATRELLTHANGDETAPAELEALRHVWGLDGVRSRDDDDDDAAAHATPSAAQQTQQLLLAAEALDQQLDEQLRYSTLRMSDALQKLQSFERLLRVQIDERETLEAEKRERRAIAAAAAEEAAAAKRVDDIAKRLRHDAAAEQLEREFMPSMSSVAVGVTTRDVSAAVLSSSLPLSVAVLEPAAPAKMLLPGAVVALDGDNGDNEGEHKSP